MAADRLLPVSTTPGAITGDDYMDAVQEEVTGLWNTARVQATNVAGTNAITFDYNPPLTAGILDGMSVLVRPIDDNTGAVTFNGDPCYAADGTSVIDEPGSLL